MFKRIFVSILCGVITFSSVEPLVLDATVEEEIIIIRNQEENEPEQQQPEQQQPAQQQPAQQQSAQQQPEQQQPAQQQPAQQQPEQQQPAQQQPAQQQPANTTKKTTQGSNKKKEVTATPEPTKEPTKEPTVTPEPTKEPTKEPTPKPTKEPTKKQEKQETAVVDGDDFTPTPGMDTTSKQVADNIPTKSNSGGMLLNIISVVAMIFLVAAVLLYVFKNNNRKVFD